MLKMSKKLFAVLGAFALVGLAISAPEAQARPSYPKMFIGKYENMKDLVAEVKCGVCHPEMDKKIRNDYGKALVEALDGAKNAKEDAFNAALEKAAAAKNGDGKSFGELIKDGKLPK